MYTLVFLKQSMPEKDSWVISLEKDSPLGLEMEFLGIFAKPLGFRFLLCFICNKGNALTQKNRPPFVI